MPLYIYNNVNASKLRDEFVAAGYNDGFGYALSDDNTVLGVQVASDVEITESELLVVVNAHDETTLTEMQQVAGAAQILLQQGQIYLIRQFLQQSPSAPTIYTEIRSHVDENAALTQMMINQVGLLALSLGWTAADVLTPTTNANRARYIFAMQQLVALAPPPL